MKKYCPLCDREVKGSFCKNCKSFIKPYEAERNFRLNERHGENTPGADKDCDYHQTSSKTYYTDPTGVRAEDYMNPKPQRTNAEFQQSLRPGSLAPKANGWQRPEEQKKSDGSRNIMIVVWIIVGISIFSFVLSFIPAVLIGMSAVGDRQEDNHTVNIETASEDVSEGISSVEPDREEDTSTSGIRDQLLQTPPTLEAEEYESLLAENGFDESGIKEMDYDEIMEAGEPCNGYIHFSKFGSPTADTVSWLLGVKECEVSPLNTDGEPMMSNYCYMNEYGEIYSYYETYDYYTIDDDRYDYGYNGYIYFVSDTVTGQLMYVGINTDDMDAFKTISQCVLQEVVDTSSLISFVKNFDDDFEGALSDGTGETYLEYGRVYYDIAYYEEESDDYYQYQAYIYLGKE